MPETLSKHGIATLRRIMEKPQLRSTVNPGLGNLLLRIGFVTAEERPSALRTHKGKAVVHYVITKAAIDWLQQLDTALLKAREPIVATPLTEEQKARARKPGLPRMFAMLLPYLVELGREEGYAIGVHGSLARDLDLIAVPWVEGAAAAEHLVTRIAKYVSHFQDPAYVIHGPALKPHGRRAWNIVADSGAVIDISVMPRPGYESVPTP